MPVYPGNHFGQTHLNLCSKTTSSGRFFVQRTVSFDRIVDETVSAIFWRNLIHGMRPFHHFLYIGKKTRTFRKK